MENLGNSSRPCEVMEQPDGKAWKEKNINLIAQIEQYK